MPLASLHSTVCTQQPVYTCTLTMILSRYCTRTLPIVSHSDINTKHMGDTQPAIYATLTSDEPLGLSVRLTGTTVPSVSAADCFPLLL